MGSVAAGLGAIGNTLGQARQLSEQEALAKRKLAIDEIYNRIQQQYASTNAKRFGLEQQEFAMRQKLAQQPKFVGFRNIGDRVVYGVQNPDGSVDIKEAPGGPDAGQDQSVIEQSIQALPKDAQESARAAVYPYIVSGNYKSARDALKPILQKYSQSQFPQPTTVTDTTQNVVLDTPQGPQVFQIPKRTVTSKQAGKSASAASRGISQSSIPAPPGSRILGAKPASRTEIAKITDPVQDADRRYKVMLDAATHPNPQNDVALLFNHIGMTLSAQRGARITNAEIQRAISAREVSGDLLAMWQKVTSGQFLTPQQRQDMVSLGKVNRQILWEAAWQKSISESLANKLPKTLPGLPPVPGVHYVGEDVHGKDGKRYRVTAVNPDGTIEAKAY